MSQAHDPKRISVVVTCLNEELNVRDVFERVSAVFREHLPKYQFELVYVDNGSTDRTGELVSELCAAHRQVKLVRLSRNFGYEGGIQAGIHYATGDALIALDADLQDPPELLPLFVKEWEAGYAVVYGVKTQRRASWYMRFAYRTFYRVLKRISEYPFPEEAGEFALMDRKVYRLIDELSENKKFIRALRFWSGFRQIGIPYQRAARAKGESKHSLTDATKLAVDGFLSFSAYPLRMIAKIGFFVLLLSGAGIVYIFVWRFLYPRSIPGYAAIMTAVLFMGGVQMMSIGVLGEYIYRVLNEVRRRTCFIVDEVKNADS
jgi:polyisoprenyl-phosphate glycosyltransferase